MQHSSNRKHNEAIDKTQSKLCISWVKSGESAPSTSKSLEMVLPGDEGQKAEIFWLAKVASNNFSLSAARQIYGDLLVILGSPRVTYYTSYTFDFNVNISSMYHLKT